MQHVEGTCAQTCGVADAELGGEVQRATPKRIDESESPLSQIGIEIENSGVRLVSIEVSPMHGQLDGVAHFRTPKPRDGKDTANALAP